MKRFVVLFTLLMLAVGCQNQNDRKIKLSDAENMPLNLAQTSSSTLQITPEQQRSIAILYFKNDTRDASLEWLRRGLTDMLVTELSQSPYLNIITMQRLSEIAGQNGPSGENLEDLSAALLAARQAKAEMVLSGHFFNDDHQLRIEVEMYNVHTAQVVRRETVNGEGLERIFSMVGELSEKVRKYLRGDFQDFQNSRLNLAEMTRSVDAFRCYSEGLEYEEKLFHKEAEKCLEDAINYDTTFAAAYLQLTKLKFQLGKKEAGKQLLQKTQKYAHKLSELDGVRLQLIGTLLKGDIDKMPAILQEAVNRYPSDIDLRQQLAYYYRGIGDIKQALEEFEMILEIDPHRKLIYNELGYLFAYRGDFTTALQYINKYREYAPNEPNPFDSKGEILMMAGRLKEAEEQLQTALSQWPTFYNSALRLSELAIEFADFKQALAYSDKALEAVPSGGIERWVRLNRALMYWRFKRYQEAEAIFKQLIEENPDALHTVLLAGDFYGSIGKPQSATALYGKILSHLKNTVSRKNYDIEQADNYAAFFVRANLPPEEIIPLAEKILAGTENTQIRALFQFVLGLNHLRANHPGKAESYFYGNASELLNLLACYRHGGWNSKWKYFFEALTYETRRPSENRRFSEMLLEYARNTHREDLELVARLSQAFYQVNSGRPARFAEECQKLGFPLEEKWRLIGPFTAENVSGYEYQYPPETELALEAVYRSGDREVRWQTASDESGDGYIDLRKNFKQAAWKVGYGLIYLHSPEKRKVQIRLGADEACKLWLNNKLIWKNYLKEDAVLDRDLVTVFLHRGYNKLLLKVTNSYYGWGYYLRVTDENGQGFKDITFHSAEEVDQPLAWGH